MPEAARLSWRVVTAVVVTLVGLATLLVPLATLPPLDTQAWIGLEVERVAHVGLSAGAVVLWAWARPRLPLAALTALGVGCAVATELLQALPSVQRSAEVEDFVYNLIGIALGLALLLIGRGVRWGTRGVMRASAGLSGASRGGSVSRRSRP